MRIRVGIEIGEIDDGLRECNRSLILEVVLGILIKVMRM